MTYLASDIRTLIAGDAWHGPAWSEILRGVDAQQAARHVLPGVHSIYELAHHTAAWAGEVCQRLGGKAPSLPAEGDWPSSEQGVDAAEWRRVADRVTTAHDALLAAIDRFDPARLDDRIGVTRDAPLGSGVTYRAMIAGIFAHTAYHAGQAMLLRRIGSLDSRPNEQR
jgi:uncharacterized damage-inducible protein DinB